MCRDVMITERLDYSSAVALLGYALVITVIRVGSLRVEAAQVMVAAPLIAFTATHIMFLNFYTFDYGTYTSTLNLLSSALDTFWFIA